MHARERCGAMSQPSRSVVGAIVIDSNILISICSKEPTYHKAETTLSDYASRGWPFYAPGAILTEVLFILCQKLQSGLLTQAEHQDTIEAFNDYMQKILPSPKGDIAFIRRAEELRRGYGCSRSADCFYIALAEELALKGPTKLLTFDQALENQVKQNAPTVSAHLLV